MAKKVEIEMTDNAIIPKSVHEVKHNPKVASRGDVIEVYEDVADKLVLYKKAVRTSDPGAPSIKETEERNAEEEKLRRQNLLTGDEGGEEKKSRKSK